MINHMAEETNLLCTVCGAAACETPVLLTDTYRYWVCRQHLGAWQNYSEAVLPGAKPGKLVAEFHRGDWLRLPHSTPTLAR